MSINVCMSNNEIMELGKSELIIGVSVAFAIIVAFYVLRSVGIFVMSIKADLEHAWLSWIPALWIYPVCKLIGESRLFGSPAKKMAGIVCVLFTLTAAIGLAYDLFTIIPLVGYTIQGGEVYYSGIYDVKFYSSAIKVYRYNSEFYINTSTFNDPYSNGMVNFLRVLSYVNMIGELINVIIEVFVVFALFRRYWPNHYILGSVLSVFFGLFGVFVFVVRNNAPVNYEDYIRARMGYRVVGAQPRNNRQNEESPFGEFDKKGSSDGEEPFGEFSDKKDDKE